MENQLVANLGEKHIKVIGFFGVATSGKSTAAHYAAQWFRDKGHPAQVRSFAGPLKDGLKEMGIEKDTYPILYRQAAQYMGTEICREYDENWWVNQMRNRIDSLPDGSVVLIDDCRFMNEFEYLKEIGATLIFVSPGERVDITTPVYSHDSEKIAVIFENHFRQFGSYKIHIPFLFAHGYDSDLIEADYPLVNTGTMTDMFTKLDTYLTEIEGTLP